MDARNQPVKEIVVLLLLFACLWIPRTVALDVSNTVDERLWLSRAANYAFAVGQSDWEGTYQREHPAVPVLWLGALGVLEHVPDFVEAAPGYFNPDQPNLEAWLEQSTDASARDLLTSGRWWIALAISLVLTLAYMPLHRLVRRGEAFFILLFVGWAPWSVALSQQLQPDGLVSALILTALVYFLAWLYAGYRAVDLFASGFIMGLAWLTKTPAALLLLTGIVLIAIEWLRERRQRSASQRAKQAPPPGASFLFTRFCIWAGTATLVFVLLWPVMWVDPVGTIRKILMEMLVYTGGHVNPNFFLGRVVADPGPLFYPVAYLFRTSPGSLIGLIVAVIAFWRRMPPLDRRTARAAFRGFVLFGLIFILVMTIPGKKFDRYVLPTHLALDAVAAMGWLVLGRWIVSWLDARHRSSHSGRNGWLVGGIALFCGLFLLHGVFTARHYPYYLTYFNPLVGGTRTAPEVLLVGWGEGLDEAGRWLDAQDESDRSRVISWYAQGPLSYYFGGRSIGLVHGSRMPWLDVDYVVLYANQIQRYIPNQPAVEYLMSREPQQVIVFRELELARIYDLRDLITELTASAPIPESVAADASWPDFAIANLETIPIAQSASVLPVRATFSPTPADDAYKISMRLSSRDGTLIAQRDVKLTDQIDAVLFVPPDAESGLYDLYALIYLDDGSLEPVATTEGQEIVSLVPVEVIARDLRADGGR